MLKGVEILLVKAFDKFQIILGTTNLALLPARRRLLKLVQRLRKRNTRIARLYTAGTGATTRRRKPISTELNDPNNRYLLSDGDGDDNEATQLTRRNGKPQVPI